MQIMLKTDNIRKDMDRMETIHQIWDKIADMGSNFWGYTQTVILDLLAGNINQGTIGVMLVLSGIGLLLLMFIFSAIFPSRHIEAKTDMMASLAKHSIINMKARETAIIDVKADPVTEDSKQFSDLKIIETDMKALKELYTAGRIQADIYVTESRSLYDAAKAIYSF
jgi:hypothetical protein